MIDPLQDISDANLRLTALLFAELERRAVGIQELTDTKLQILTGNISKVQRAASTVLGRVQTIRREARLAASRMTLTEKRAAVVDFFSAQPREIQLQLMQELVGVLNATETP